VNEVKTILSLGV